MKAVEELKMEHRGIEVMLQVMNAISERLGRGEPVPAPHLDGILEFLTVFIDTCHHGKEEEFLFPALESAGVAREGGPIGVMLREHQEGRDLAARLRQSAPGCKSGDQTAVAELRNTVQEYVNLLFRHIEKEDTVLFPMADARLDADQDATLVEAFERLERERIGPGRHEAFHALLDQLEDAYLKT